MIKKDRELLHRMATINQGLAGVVLAMTDRQDGGELNPDDLRVVGGGLFQLGLDMLDRADELTPPVIDPAPSPATSVFPCRAGRMSTSAARRELADLLERTAAHLRAAIPHPPEDL